MACYTTMDVPQACDICSSALRIGLTTCDAGAVLVPDCKSVAQVQERVSALGWRLNSNKVAIIDPIVSFTDMK